MTADFSTIRPAPLSPVSPPAARPPAGAAKDERELRAAFDSFVGEVFYGQMLKAMRKTTGKPAYFHGGRTEEIFTQQLDQVLAEKLSATSAQSLSGPMFELFRMRRR
jgi:Rod binding domain-containing protein